MEVALYDCKLETLSNDEDSLSVSIYEPDDVKDINTIVVILNGYGIEFMSSLNNYKEPYTLTTDLCNYGTHKFSYACKIYKSNPRFWTKDLLESSRFSRYKYAYHGYPANIWASTGPVITLSLTDPDFSAPDTLNQNGIDFTNVDGMFGDELTESYKYRKITATECYTHTFEFEAKRSEAKLPYIKKHVDPSGYCNSLCDFIITLLDDKTGEHIVDGKTGKNATVKYIGCVGGKYEWTCTGLSSSIIHDGVVKRGSWVFELIMNNFKYPCTLSNLYEWVDIPNSGDPSKYDFVGIKVFDYDYWYKHRSEKNLFTPWGYLIYAEYDYYDINEPSDYIKMMLFSQKSVLEYNEYSYNKNNKIMKFYNGKYEYIIDPNGRKDDKYSRPLRIECSGHLDPHNTYKTTLYVKESPFGSDGAETMTFLFSSNIELFKEE